MHTKAVKKKKQTVKRVRALHAGVEASTLVDLEKLRIYPVPILKAALICEVDDRKSWEAKTGMLPATLPEVVRIAANLCAGARCYFCAKPQEPMPKATVFHFRTDYPLCTCLITERNVAYEHIPGWDTPEGNAALLAQAEAGTVQRSAPVYQFVCACGAGPTVVHVGLVVGAIRKYGKHYRRWRCDKCYDKRVKAVTQARPPKKEVLTAPIEQIVGAPKEGPAGKFNKNRKHKKNRGIPAPQHIAAPIPENSLPPLAALEKATEAPTA